MTNPSEVNKIIMSLGDRDTKTKSDYFNPPLGLRYNEGKPRMTLTSPYALEGLAKVLGFGAQKYAAWNWAKGLQVDQTIDCLLRHVQAIQKGELIDKESGLPHIDHVGCNWMFLSHFYHTGRWEDLSKGLMPTTIKTGDNEPSS